MRGGSRDLWAGLSFVATGAVAMAIAREYAAGTTLRMGPGYFPRALGGILVLFGLWVMLAGLRRGEPIPGGWPLRPLLVLPGSMVLFGVLVEHAGFLPAMVALVLGAAAAGREFKVVEVLVLTGLLSVLSVVVFVWLLGLPYPLLKGF